ncbi:MAG: PLP-dependent aminotransferase family protein [Gemmatimonadota bacterium]|nr:PLP-dependent aminotransferase family protein [Gemmatimonadota bacterium]
MPRPLFSRRATPLAATLPAGAPAGAIAFDSGHASPSVLPDLTAVATRALNEHRDETLQYAPRPGLPELRQWIAEYMTADGCPTKAEEILVTNGAKHAIELICRLVLDEGDSIVMTSPTYFTAIPIFKSFGVSFIEIGQDHEGLDVAELASVLAGLASAGKPMPKLIYNVPDFHNPTGISMPVARRRALIELARRYEMLIIEDSPYRKVRFEGESVPPLKGLDTDGVVCLVGTFSKLMAPGLRVGWVAATPALIARLVQLKSDGGSCPLTQRIIVDFCRGGALDAHILRVQSTYRSHRDRMVAAMKRELPSASFDVPAGGYYLWLELPATTDGDDVARLARDAGVIVLAGSKFFAPGDAPHPKNFVRVAFSHATGDEIDEGVRRLAAAYASATSGASAMAGAR